MVKRVCKECGEALYSSSTTNEDWKCEKCKSDISKSQEKNINE